MQNPRVQKKEMLGGGVTFAELWDSLSQQRRGSGAGSGETLGLLEARRLWLGWESLHFFFLISAALPIVCRAVGGRQRKQAKKLKEMGRDRSCATAGAAFRGCGVEICFESQRIAAAAEVWAGFAKIYFTSGWVCPWLTSRAGAAAPEGWMSDSPAYFLIALSCDGEQ